jgi:hypothetical protein
MTNGQHIKSAYQIGSQTSYINKVSSACQVLVAYQIRTHTGWIISKAEDQQHAKQLVE